MEQYAIVYFPHIHTEKIDAFRKKYYPQWAVIAPHITLVSSLANVSENHIIEHIKTITGNINAFHIRLHGLMKTDDDHLFLLVKEGKEEIVRIHGELHSDIIAREQEYSFLPHLTLGIFNTENNQKMFTEAEDMNLDIHAIFDTISLIKGDGVSPAKIVKTFDLKL